MSFPREPVTFIQHFLIPSFFGWISFLRKVKLPTDNTPQADTRKGPPFKANEQWAQPGWFSHHTLKELGRKNSNGEHCIFPMHVFILHTHSIYGNILARAWSTSCLGQRIVQHSFLQGEKPFQPQLTAQGCDAVGAQTCPAEGQWLQNAEGAASCCAHLTEDACPSRVSWKMSKVQNFKISFSWCFNINENDGSILTEKLSLNSLCRSLNRFWHCNKY